MLNSEELITKVKSYNKFLNPETLTKAYNFALKAHEKQKRDEGSPYIIHPIAVANINSPTQIVVSGSEKDIEKAMKLSKEINIRKAVKLNVPNKVDYESGENWGDIYD